MSTLWRLTIGLIVLSLVTTVSFVFLPQRIEFTEKTSARAAERVDLNMLFGNDNQWFNALSIGKSDLEDKVVLLMFVNFSDKNSRETLKDAVQWYEQQKNKGLEIVVVHVPKWSFEKQSRYVLNNIGELNLKFPIMQDNGLVQKTFGLDEVPAWFLFDQNGEYVADVKGRINSKKLKGMLEDLVDGKPAFTLKMKGSAPVMDDENIVTIHAGNNYVESSELTDDLDEMELNTIYFTNDWQQTDEALIQKKEQLKSFVAVRYQGYSVGALLAPGEGKGAKVSITLDDKPVPRDLAGEYITYDEWGGSFLQVHEPRLYRLLDSFDRQEHVVKIYPNTASVALYSVTLEE